VLNEGKVHEQGKFQELMDKGGLFHELAKKQEEYKVVDKAAMKDGAGPASAASAGGMTATGPAQEVSPHLMESSQGAAEKAGPEEEGGDMFGAMKRLLGMQSDHTHNLVLMSILSFGACVCPSIAFYQMTAVMTVLYEPKPEEMRGESLRITTLLGIMAGATIAGFTLSHFFNALAGSALTRKLRKQGFSALLHQDIGYFDIEQNSAPNLTTFLSEKVDKVQTLTTEQLDLVAQLLGGVGSSIFIIFWWCSWQLALVWAAVVPVLGIITSMELAFMSGGEDGDAAKKGKEDTSKKGAAQKSANHIIGEAVMGIRTVASYNLEQRFYGDYCKTSGEIADYMKRDAKVQGFFQMLSNVCMMAIMGGVFYYAVWLANEGVIGFTEAMGPLFVITGAMVPLMKLSALADIKNAVKSAEKFFEMCDRRPAIDSFSEEGLTPPACRGEVVVTDVVFAYPTAVDHQVCRGFSLHVPAGTSMALCGASGSGKSTLIQLLERFYDPLSGSITLDGVDIKSLNVRWLRSQLGLVGQEPVLFQGTVAQNIAFGKSTAATPAEIEKAARAANAHGFITENLQNGYETEVGLKGGRLSGGQKQRVAIARALIKQPAILLLDEATSALDNQSEAVVQAAIDEVMKTQKLTTIIIAHRLSTIRNADAIAVLNEGKVIEKGTHQQLLALQGMYSSLVLSQS